MSFVSGKCDIYDLIYASCRNNDWEMKKKAFEIFKEETGGKLYQNLIVELNPWNLDKEIEYINRPEFLSKEIEVIQVPDKRCKSGFKTKEKVFVKYLGKLIPLEKKPKVCVHKVIYFEDMIDLVPYYPYIVSSYGRSVKDGKIVCSVTISKESYLDSRYLDTRKLGGDISYLEHYRKNLKEELINTVLELNKDSTIEKNSEVEK